MIKLPYHKLSATKILDIWGDSTSLKAITVGGLSESERLTLFNKFIDEGGMRFSGSLFIDESNTDFYILWDGGEAIGILNVYTTTRLSKHERSVYIEPKAVFILEKYRGEGLGYDLCTTVANYLSKNLISRIAKSNLEKGDGINFLLFADYESEEGESFCENFYAQFTQHGPLLCALNLMGIDIHASLDAGY